MKELEKMTDDELMQEFDELHDEVYARLEPYYTMENNPLGRLLSASRELERREDK